MLQLEHLVWGANSEPQAASEPETKETVFRG